MDKLISTFFYGTAILFGILQVCGLNGDPSIPLIYLLLGRAFELKVIEFETCDAA